MEEESCRELETPLASSKWVRVNLHRVELGAYSGGGNEVEIENGLVFFGTRNGMQIVDFESEFAPEPSGILLRFTALAVVGFLAGR